MCDNSKSFKIISFDSMTFKVSDGGDKGHGVIRYANKKLIFTSLFLHPCFKKQKPTWNANSQDHLNKNISIQINFFNGVDGWILMFMINMTILFEYFSEVINIGKCRVNSMIQIPDKMKMHKTIN